MAASIPTDNVGMGTYIAVAYPTPKAIRCGLEVLLVLMRQDILEKNP